MAQDVNFKKTTEQETHYGTGAQRDNRNGKGALHWVPWDAMFCVARIYELGNKGRSKTDGNDRNWENGMPILDLCQSAMNHITAYIAGDRSEPHLPMAAWNVLNAIQMSIWVHLGFRPKSLNTLPNHRANWKPGDEPPCPLSPQEIEWLQFKGVIPTPQAMTVAPPGGYDFAAADGRGVISPASDHLRITAKEVTVSFGHDPHPVD